MSALAPAADSLSDARALLDSHGLSCSQVLSVDRDSILYLNALGRPRTVWLHRPECGPLRIDMQPGFVAVEPAGLHARRPGDEAVTNLPHLQGPRF